LSLLGERPTVDFGLVTLARALGLPPGGAKALFALGRTVGWIGHTIEQYVDGSLIRPRARYVGELPAGSA
jgi:citrate synthase